MLSVKPVNQSSQTAMGLVVAGGHWFGSYVSDPFGVVYSSMWVFLIGGWWYCNNFH